MFDGLLGDELAHAIVDAPPGQDDLRVVAQHLCLVGQVVRVDTDAVATHQTGFELQEVPLGAGRFEHLGGVDPKLVKNDRQLVHECDVEVALGVLDHLGGFCRLDAGGAMHAGHDDTFVQLSNLVQRVGRVTRHDLQNAGQGVFFVARVDALWRIPHKKILLPAQAGLALQHRDANLFGGTRVHGGLVHHRHTFFHVAAHAGARPDERPEIRYVGGVNRGRHGNNDEICLGQHGRVCGVDRVGGRAHLVVGQLTRWVNTTQAGLHLRNRDIEADGTDMFAEFDHQRQPDITQTNYRNHCHHTTSQSSIASLGMWSINFALPDAAVRL